MSRFSNITAGLVLGALFGAGLALLLTPQSGEDLRRTIQERFNDILEEGRAAAEARRLELQDAFSALKEPAPRRQ